MVKGYLEDTIAAISTPPGEGGIGIVRMSGKESLAITGRIFRFSEEGKKELRNYRIHYGHIIDPDGGKVIDEVLLLLMRAPHSYTREDVVEIQCHGGVLPLTRILELIIREGARMAQPGEFTKRAFIHGRIDIIQAEAVIDIVRGKTEKAMEIAYEQLSGHVSRDIESLRQKLIQVIAALEAEADFPEEEIPSLSGESLMVKVKELRAELSGVVERSKTGRLFREGIRVAIVGKPNVGKSSLLNVILKESRAIVTPYPGTTRDCIEEWLNLKGIPMILTDTAGIRETDDPVEIRGVEKTIEAIDRASLVMVVIDISGEVTEEDCNIMRIVEEKKQIVVLNKVDLLSGSGASEVDESVLEIEKSKSTVRISAKEETGIDEMKEIIYGKVWQGEVVCADGCIVSNTRQRESLIKALEALKCVEEMLYESTFPTDVYLVDLRKALAHIGEIFGENFDEEILDAIFSEFCIGK